MSPIQRANDPDLNLLLALEALLAEGNVTRAAKKLGLSQPAMSHALSRLREQLGDPLFVRTPRGVAPTERARKMGEPLGRVLQELRGLLAGEGFDPATSRRTFTVGTPDVGQLVLLPALLQRVRAEAPAVEIASVAPGPDALTRLESGDLDLWLGAPAKLPPHYQRQALLETELVLLARKGHPGLKGKLTLEKLAALPHLKLAFRGGLGAPIDAALARAGLTAKFALSMNDLVAAIFVAAKTDLVVVGSDLVASIFEGTLPIEAHRLPVPDARRPIFQIWHERQQRDAGHAWFRRCVFEAAKAVA